MLPGDNKKPSDKTTSTTPLRDSASPATTTSTFTSDASSPESATSDYVFAGFDHIFQVKIKIQTEASKDLPKADISEIRKASRKISRNRDIDHSNYAVRALESCLLELYKNSRDSGAVEIKINFYKDDDKQIVQIQDNGSGFTHKFLTKFNISDGQGGAVYPDLRAPKRRDIIPYESDKHAVDDKTTTGGAGLGMYYLALITQGADDGQLQLGSRADGESGASFLLSASSGNINNMGNIATYGLPELNSYYTENSRQVPKTPQDMKEYSFKPTRPGSPAPR